MYDLLIKNAEVIDGTGNPRQKTDVAVKDGKIRIASGTEEAQTVIDGTGRILCPGFIDVHSHGDLVAGHDYARLCKTSQGITTEVAGQCGNSFFPVLPETAEAVMSNALMLGELEEKHMKEFLGQKEFADFLGKQSLSANMMTFMGHSTLRLLAMGSSDARPDRKQMKYMEETLKESMEEGCAGLSTGLFYPPSAYGNVEEVSGLCAVAARYGGIHTTHMRNEGAGILDSVKEVLEISRRSGIALNISHHKICGKKNRGLSEQTLELADEARKEGIQVTMDVYPYTASMTKLAACIPAEYFVKGTDWLQNALRGKETRRQIREKMETFEDGRYLQCGGFSGIMIGGCPSRPDADGRFLSEYAAETGEDPFDVFFDLVAENGSRCSAIYFSMDEEDLERIIRWPYTMIGTDGLTVSMNGKTHPRSWGTFPRALRIFVKEKKILSMEEMIRRMTGLPAETYHMTSRGRIADGYAGDLVLFDEAQIRDQADYSDSCRLSSGICCVAVDGKIVYRDGKMTGEFPGKWVPFRG